MEALARTLHIGRHASFNVDVTFHDLSNVPHVSGTFACKWRFKNAMAAPLPGQLIATTDPPPLPHLPVPSTSRLHPNSAFFLRPKHDDDNGSFEDDASDRRESDEVSRPNRSFSTMTARQPSKPEPTGSTDAVTLAKHTAHYNGRVVHCAVSTMVSKTGELAECPLRIIVKQSFHDDLGKTADSRLGELNIDLAEFAHVKTPTTRRFLLNHSKTNALLRLTISLTQFGGAIDFVPRNPKAKKEKNAVMGNSKANTSSRSLISGRKSKKSNKTEDSPTSSLRSKRSDQTKERRTDANSVHPPPLHRNRSTMPDRHPHHHIHTSDPEALIEHLFNMELTDAELPPTPIPDRHRLASSPDSEASRREGRVDSMSSNGSSARKSSAPSSVMSGTAGGQKQFVSGASQLFPLAPVSLRRHTHRRSV